MPASPARKTRFPRPEIASSTSDFRKSSSFSLSVKGSNVSFSEAATIKEPTNTVLRSCADQCTILLKLIQKLLLIFPREVLIHHFLDHGLRFRMSPKASKKSKTRRLRNSSDLGDTPQWALNADQAFLERKLEIVRKRKREGKPAHGKYENYESNLRNKL